MTKERSLRLIAIVGYVAAVVGIIGFVVAPSAAFGLVKLPQDVWNFWKRHRSRNQKNVES